MLILKQTIGPKVIIENNHDLYRSFSTLFLGYNSALQRRAQRNHLSIWTLIELLITEETAVRIKHFQALNGKRKTVNKRIRDDITEINENIIVPTMATFPIYRFCFPFRSYFYER